VTKIFEAEGIEGSRQTGEIFKYFQTRTPEASEKFSKVQTSVNQRLNLDSIKRFFQSIKMGKMGKIKLLLRRREGETYRKRPVEVIIDLYMSS
jgi:hypothetical protein